MGYDLHITRKGEWSSSTGPAITPDEWLKVIESDPELRLAGHNGEYFAIWMSHPHDPEAWIDWDAGNLYSKNPDLALIRKMEQIASRLQARVVGDEGEEYHDGQANAEDEDGADAGESARRANSRALLRLAILYLAALAVLGLLGIMFAAMT